MVIDRTYRGMETEIQVRCNDVAFNDGIATLRIPCEKLDDENFFAVVSDLDWPDWAVDRLMATLHRTSRDVLLLRSVVENGEKLQ